MSDQETPISGHEYDGIKEFDNPLPMWWLITFYGAIIFGFLYWIHYEFGGGATLLQELDADMAKIEQMQKKHSGPADSEEDLAKLAAAGAGQGKGKEVYDGKCAVCHGPELQGSIGPNLTDDFWIHGKGTAAEIAQLVRAGITDKGMPAWDGQLKADEIQAVAVYVASAKGTNPPNPKAPQGNKVGN